MQVELQIWETEAEQLLIASIFSEKFEAIFSAESKELWKRYERYEEKLESWEFIESGRKQFGKRSV